MTRYLLDTNILSNITKPVPSESLVAWMAQQADESLFISTLTVAEIWRGVLEGPAGKKRQQLERWFAGRILPFDDKAALIWGRIMAKGTKAGKPRSAIDMIVAAIAEANDCVVVTDNEKHFIGLKIVNPLRLSTL
jgi:predicted nucleic acid-binding protein